MLLILIVPVAGVMPVSSAGTFSAHTGTIHRWIISVVNNDYSSSHMKQSGLLGYGVSQDCK